MGEVGDMGRGGTWVRDGEKSGEEGRRGNMGEMGER